MPPRERRPRCAMGSTPEGPRPGTGLGAERMRARPPEAGRRSFYEALRRGLTGLIDAA